MLMAAATEAGNERERLLEEIEEKDQVITQQKEKIRVLKAQLIAMNMQLNPGSSDMDSIFNALEMYDSFKE